LRVLITNDDGFHAEGIQTLVSFFENKHDVWVVAPDREQSASSHKLTLNQPLRLFEHGMQRYSVNGTPTDSVYVGVHLLMKEKPDVIVSGINRGPNMGDDVTYSGTVAAAMEGAVLGIPSIAISVNGWENLDFRPAGKVALYLAEKILKEGLPQSVFLNANVPLDLKEDSLHIEYTKLGKRNYGQYVVERKDPRGKPYYWIGGDANGSEPIDGSDIDTVKKGLVSVTPLTLDLTAHDTLEAMKKDKTTL